ncbi:MAG: Mrp/NBP35 family ATP-binding protein [Hyphomicrobiales bacterium]|nr:Mrp/NBP35 family ATP-binding protein [Hyphomicrobiales bacterium]
MFSRWKKPASEADARSVLKGVRIGDIAADERVEDIIVRESGVIVTLGVAPEQAASMEPLRLAAEKALLESGAFSSASVTLTHHREEAPRREEAPPQRAPKTPDKQTPNKRIRPDGVENIVLVASGKGGVGKSTVAVNLALALNALGKRVGLLDADIHGPSIALMMGLEGKPETSDGKTILPKEKYGLRCMSIGLMTTPDMAVIWRGPMVQSALMQLLGDVEWGALDVLVIDLPPGTGDVQLTLSQQVDVTGAVIVSTPQEVALLDVRRSINMFARVEVPVLGVVENMAYFAVPGSDEKRYIFGQGGARRLADEMSTAFLGEIPLMEEICAGVDSGAPALTKPDSIEAKPFLELAQKVWERVQKS